MPGTFTATILALCSVVYAGFDLGRDGGDSDLTSFVTRPEIKAPLMTVNKYKPDQIDAGYWFLAPYTHLEQPSQPAKYYQSCQSGPAIYDQDGELIWSGACYFKNQNAYDFRAFRENGTDFLSLILFAWPSKKDYKGHAVIMNSSFAAIDELFVPNTMAVFNMHEFRVVDGYRALHVPQRTTVMDLEPLTKDYGLQVGLVTDTGLRETDLRTNEIIFDWWPADHISLDDSNGKVSQLNGPYPAGWDWIHTNSVDKNSEGDYMLSARYTDAIYKVSGRDGSVLWTLGGRNSSFVLEKGLTFSRQHDARFLSQDDASETITLFDNGGDELIKTSNDSSALVVVLDKTTMTARIKRKWTRPDGKMSRLRGNFQLLDNGNAFVGWSDNAKISEHSWDGDLLMTASFVSDRFVTYRSYKFNFTATPQEAPVLKAFVYGVDAKRSTTVCYVSWNGATEVAFWDFYRIRADGSRQPIGRAKRSGFETVFQVAGYENEIVAYAISADGKTLGKTDVQAAEVVGSWATSTTSVGETGRKTEL